ncbi:SIR2 family protein [Myxococcota bacterium]
MSSDDKLERLAQTLAAHKAIPFIGAGCSAAINPTWDQIRDRMADELGITSTDHIEVARIYEEQRGRSELIAFLRRELLAKDVVETSIPVYSALLSMELGVHYTTNQDNVMELLFAKLGRLLQVVADLDGIVTRSQYDPTLYKYHGSLDLPDTVVFSRADYDKRIAQRGSNPLDIRLRSDLLGKGLAFMGYSFNDPNVRLLFEELRQTFPEGLPPSFFIQYSPNADFDKELSEDYGMVVITPGELYPDASSNGEAFERLFEELGQKVVSARIGTDIHDLFHVPDMPERVLTERELRVLEQLGDEGRSFADQVQAFRAKIDATRIPEELEDRVVDLFVALCQRASSVDEAVTLQPAYFNFHLSKPAGWFTVLSSLMATGNLFPDDQMTVTQMMFSPAVRFAKRREDVYVFAAAGAIAMLREWGREVLPGLHHCMSYWNGAFLPRKDIPEALRPRIEEAFRWAYSKRISAYENPLDYADRVNGRKSLFRSPGFNEIYSNMIESVQKRMKLPGNE